MQRENGLVGDHSRRAGPDQLSGIIRDASDFSLLILATRVNARLAFRPQTNPERNGFAADLAILDVLLVPCGRVDRNLKKLTTVGAANVGELRRVHGSRCSKGLPSEERYAATRCSTSEINV